ncbi:MAG: putative lipoprotein [Bacteroidota bacterium]|nr:putative lipoprotein [Bacteroidota bacterium]
MKKSTLTVALSTLMAVFIFIGCHNSKEEKLEDAKENIDQAKEDIQQANSMDSTSTSSVSVTTNTSAGDNDWTVYRKDIEARIARLNDRITDLRIKIKKPGVALDNMRVRRIDELQERIAALKAKIGGYKYDANGWPAYKTDLDRELDQLQKDLDAASK